MSFLSFLCSSQNLHLSYYLVNFALNILTVVGGFLLVPMFWKLHKVRIITLTHFNIPSLCSIKVYFIPGKIAVLSSVQQRKRFFLCCVIMLYLLWLCWCILDSLQQILIYLKQALETYFHCQALGHLPNQTSQCDPKEYQQSIYPELAVTTYFLMTFITTANLTFVINWSTVTKFCSHYYHKKEKSYVLYYLLHIYQLCLSIAIIVLLVFVFHYY